MLSARPHIALRASGLYDWACCKASESSHAYSSNLAAQCPQWKARVGTTTPKLYNLSNKDHLLTAMLSTTRRRQPRNLRDGSLASSWAGSCCQCCFTTAAFTVVQPPAQAACDKVACRWASDLPLYSVCMLLPNVFDFVKMEKLEWVPLQK
jgi:hypothetical protein